MYRKINIFNDRLIGLISEGRILEGDFPFYFMLHSIFMIYNGGLLLHDIAHTL